MLECINTTLIGVLIALEVIIFKKVSIKWKIESNKKSKGYFFKQILFIYEI